MSIDSERVSCTRCCYQTLESHRPIVLVYVVEGEEPIETGRGKGWCYDCDAYVDTERLDRERLKQEWHELGERVAAAQAQLVLVSRGLLGRFGVPARELRLSLKRMAEARAKLNYLTRVVSPRKSRARCLTCWSERTAPVRFDEAGLSLGFTHDCGGALKLEPGDGFRFAYRTTTYVLDLEGRLLE